MIATLAVTGLIGTAAYFGPYIGRSFAVRELKKTTNAKRTLVLSYDDGPSESITPQLLGLLRSSNANATFFMLGRNAKKHSDLASRILREGHEIGCHTHHHLNAWKVSPWNAIQDINQGYEALSLWVAPNGCFRPPYGKITLPTYLAIRYRSADLGWWTIDSGDTHKCLPTPQAVADTLLSHGGGVVLLHDLDRSPERNAFVLETTALLLRVARSEGFNIKRLCDL